jgi:GNAT superfamily N-acetyltransferase
MIIRNATKDDVREVIDMGVQLQEESKEFEPLLIFDWQASYDHYAKELENKQARIIVACDSGGTITGYQYSYLTILDYLSENNRECILEAIYVKPEFRGRGIARALVQSAEQWAVREMKADRIKAGIYVGNEASEGVHVKGGFTPYYTEYIKYVDEPDSL